MKALTLTQPWATLIAIGAKKVETRSWSTLYRGPIAIHAAKGLTAVGGRGGLARIWRSQPFSQYLYTHELPLGVIVATARLVDVQPTQRYDAMYVAAPHRFAEHELAFGDYEFGRYMWFLEDVLMIPAPLHAKGALGLWDWTPPLKWPFG